MHVGEIAGLDDRIDAHPVGQQREHRHQRQVHDADSPRIAPQLTVQRRHRESHDHEMQAAAALLDHEGAVGDVDGIARYQHPRTREPEEPAQGEHRELLQEVPELRPGRHGEVEKRHWEGQQQSHAQTERRRDGKPKNRREDRDFQILDARPVTRQPCEDAAAERDQRQGPELHRRGSNFPPRPQHQRNTHRQHQPPVRVGDVHEVRPLLVVHGRARPIDERDEEREGQDHPQTREMGHAHLPDLTSSSRLTARTRAAADLSPGECAEGGKSGCWTTRSSY